MHSIGHFAGEAAESLTHADSRLWRTLVALLFRPGWLTREFFAGRRARYLPPFRLYLVVSLVYFVAAASLPGAGTPRMDVTSAPPAPATTPATGDPCRISYDGPGSRWLLPRLQAGCEKMQRQGNEALSAAFLHNLPRALFLLLPLTAAAMKLMYWRPRRHYVEHLLFLTHAHAGVFLFSTLLLLARVVIPGSNWLTLGAAAYVAWHFHRALRVVYEQRPARTLAKLLMLALVYLMLGGAVLLLTIAYSLATL